MKRLIIVGSPRTSGRSAHLAETLFEANIEERPEDELFLVPLSEVEVGPCVACNACREKTPVILKGDDGKEVSVERNRCVFDDDMQALYDLIDDADEVIVVSPVFFSGAPAQLKCLLDRLQPYYWANDREGAKRPATLHVIGEGGDPHGYDALVSEVRSALAVAGFRLQRVLDWVGKIDKQGEIVAEAHEVVFSEQGEKQRPRLDLSGAVNASGRKPADDAGGNPAKSSKKGKPARKQADDSGKRSGTPPRKGGKRGKR